LCGVHNGECVASGVTPWLYEAPATATFAPTGVCLLLLHYHLLLSCLGTHACRCAWFAWPVVRLHQRACRRLYVASWKYTIANLALIPFRLHGLQQLIIAYTSRSVPKLLRRVEVDGVRTALLSALRTRWGQQLSVNLHQIEYPVQQKRTATAATARQRTISCHRNSAIASFTSSGHSSCGRCPHRYPPSPGQCCSQASPPPMASVRISTPVPPARCRT
jgi:hypothetical protein